MIEFFFGLIVEAWLLFMLGGVCIIAAIKMWQMLTWIWKGELP